MWLRESFSFDSNCDEINDALKVVIEHFYKNCRSDDLLRYADKNKVLFILINYNAYNTPQIIDRITFCY
ncbi:Predicted protein [Wolbachia endosymbiont strain TRS of Brugia malayi]|nr:Predicted protein [Wolbachia endosymbiont strain TRS of Brugia malayi]